MIKMIFYLTFNLFTPSNDIVQPIEILLIAVYNNNKAVKVNSFNKHPTERSQVSVV